MASTIRIKRSGTSGNPTTLAQGELAYSYFNGAGGDRLYVGTGTETAGDAANHEVVGGKYYVDLLGGTGTAPFGTLTARTAIITDSDSKIDNLKVDNIDLNGNTITTTNTDGNLILDANGNGAIRISNAYNLPTADGNADQFLKTDGSGNLSFTAVPSGSFTLSDGTDSDTFTTGQILTFDGGTGITTSVTDNQISFAVTNTAVTAGSYGSATAIPTFTVNAQGQLTAAGTANVATNLSINVGAKTENVSLLDSDLSFAASGTDGLSVSYDSSSNQVDYTIGNADISGTKGVATFTSGDFTASSGTISLADDVVKDITTDTGALTPSSHGFSILGGEGMDVTHSGTTITVAGEDATASNKGVASFSGSYFTVTSGDVAIDDATTTTKGIASFNTNDFSVSNGAVSIGSLSNSQLDNNSVTFGTTEVALGATSTTLAGLTQLDVDNIRINGNTISNTDSGGILYLNPHPSGDSGELYILGNLTVQGTTTTINSTELTVNDLKITLADSATSAGEADGAGIEVNGPATKPSFTYAATGDKWVANKPLDVTGNLEATAITIGGVAFDEKVDDRVSNLLTAGEGIDLTYNDGTNELTVAAELATVTNAGVASFDSDQFTLTSGNASLTSLDGGTY